MTRRPWFAGLLAFVLVIGIGGIAVAAQQMLVEEPEPAPGLVSDAVSDDALEPELRGPDAKDEPEEVKIEEKPAKDGVTIDTMAKDEVVEEETVKDSAADSVSDEAKDATPPDLVITYPEDGAVVDDKTITFRGETEPGSVVMAAGYEADVDADGKWAITLILEPGGNTATFYAYDEAENKAVATVKVTYSAPEEEKPKDKPVDVSFTAKQHYGSCSATFAYDFFSGTAEPGSVVWAGSEYGSNEIVTDDLGFWEMKVKFPEAPTNDPFIVVVESGDNRVEFDFVWTPEPVDYAVNQWNEASDSPEPYAKFYGTAEPGTAIAATSEYGSADTVTEGSEWHLKVWLTEAPDGEPFVITVTGAGETYTFSFVVYVPE